VIKSDAKRDGRDERNCECVGVGKGGTIIQEKEGETEPMLSWGWGNTWWVVLVWV